MKTKFTMIMAVIATFAISLNLHSSNEEVVFGAPAVQMPRGGPMIHMQSFLLTAILRCLRCCHAAAVADADAA